MRQEDVTSVNFQGVDEFRSWPSSKFADPIEVENGIRLAKPVHEAVRNWWSLRWLSIICQFGLGVRLERAKLYASRGQVLSIQIENGIVKSQVQGADSEPYRVIIAVRTIPLAIWTAILSDFAGSSSFGIGLASGTLPPQEEVDRIFSKNGVLLFPDRQGEMQTKCSCLDWSNPCKHIAAVYLLLAAEFEREPLLIFKLRGLEAGDLFSMLQSPVPTEQTEPVPVSDSRTSSPCVLDHQGRTAPNVRYFWKKSVKAGDILTECSAAEETASLPRSLGDFPFWQGRTDFLTSVHAVYELAPEYTTGIFSRLSACRFP